MSLWNLKVIINAKSSIRPPQNVSSLYLRKNLFREIANLWGFYNI